MRTSDETVIVIIGTGSFDVLSVNFRVTNSYAYSCAGSCAGLLGRSRKVEQIFTLGI